MPSLYDIFSLIIIGLLSYLVIRSYLPKKKNDEIRRNFFDLAGRPRSTKWKTVRNNFIKENGICAVCGKTENLSVHHKISFHENPDLELDENNLVTLCENENLNCHFVFGHLMDWRKTNNNIEEDIKIWKEKLQD